MTGRTLIVGLGSQLGDDQIGLRIAEHLASRVGPRVDVRIATSPAQLLDWLDGTGELIACDACRCTARLGTVFHWKWPTPEIEITRFSGSHDLPLPAVLELAAQLGRLPPRVSVWAIAIFGSQRTERISAELAPSLRTAAEQILQAIG